MRGVEQGSRSAGGVAGLQRGNGSPGGGLPERGATGLRQRPKELSSEDPCPCRARTASSASASSRVSSSKPSWPDRGPSLGGKEQEHTKINHREKHRRLFVTVKKSKKMGRMVKWQKVQKKNPTDAASPQVVRVDRGRSSGASRPPAGRQQSSWRDPARSRGAGPTASAARSHERNQFLTTIKSNRKHKYSVMVKKSHCVGGKKKKVHLFHIGEGLTTTFTVRHGLLARPPG